ncbi:MAG TPA: homoserine O-acetyltransferase [Thermomicrobiales bacterium]|nr:homoserine O-acetyltransferase [Thermomicrobiales bacterium]
MADCSAQEASFPIPPVAPDDEVPARDGRRRFRIVAPMRDAGQGEQILPRSDGDLQSAHLGPMDLEMGGRLPSVTLGYRTWGRLNPAGDNAILIVHALTGDSLAAGDGGWWAPLVGPGRALDTDRAFVVCANVLGGCQGSTGPSSIDPRTGQPYAMRFPLITIGDIVNAQRRLVERLGVTRLVPIGGSIGGFQALEWATRHPDLVAAAAPLAATGALGPQGIALHGEVGRRAIMSDPDWRNGEYQAAGVFPAQGLATARMAAMVTYHSRESMAMRFGRNPATRPSLLPSVGPTFDVEGYLHHHGTALVRRFDANSYLYLTRAMDLYDVGRDGGEVFWIDKLAAPMLLLGIRSDWLFPPDEIAALADRVAARGKDVTYVELDSPHGHDAFLKEWDLMTAALRPFLDRALAAPAPGTGRADQATAG